MAEHPEDEIPESVENTIDEGLGQPTRRQRKEAKKRLVPTYQMIGNSKIPVSKVYGKVWQSRRDTALTAQKDVRESWDEAIDYFERDQSEHRIRNRKGSGNVLGNDRLNENITETENVVFANVTTMVPALYSRNPSAEFTATDEANNKMATMVERLVNALGSQKARPGFNMKPKAKRCVVTTLLTNRSWILVNWNFKAESSEQALLDIRALGKKLVKAKRPADIKEIEGQLMALEDRVNFLNPEGPQVRVLHPKQVLFDTNAQEIDLSDAHWAMYYEFIPTSFLLAMYAKRTPNSDQYKSIYAPTHILKASQGDKEEGHEKSEDFKLIDDTNNTASAFGFSDDEQFNQAKMTKVWMVWDRITQRVLMYHSNDWTWPIWVWDNPLNLDTFYPLFPLTFFESPSGPNTIGEVGYYLDQQDAINEITDELRRARLWARRNIIYNSALGIKREDIEAILKGPDGTARGVSIPEGMTLKDVMASVPLPSLNFPEVFDKEAIYKAIDRISSVGEVTRGGQFKTNTNKDAVKANVAAANMRIDEKSDQIEDWIGQIYWAIAQLCLQFMSKELAISIIGSQAAEWKTMDASEIKAQFNMSVVGGSSKKPSSAAKKEEALELGQVLGQFVNAAPGPVLKIMLEVMQEAFDEISIKSEDWDEILQAISEQQGVQGQPRPAQDTGAAGPQPTQAPQGNSNTPPTGIDENTLDQILASMPPELKGEVVNQIKQGVPPDQALQSVMN